MLPLASPACGVTVTLHTVPLPATPVIVPLLTTKSLVASPVTASANVYV